MRENYFHVVRYSYSSGSPVGKRERPLGILLCASCNYFISAITAWKITRWKKREKVCLCYLDGFAGVIAFSLWTDLHLVCIRLSKCTRSILLLSYSWSGHHKDQVFLSFCRDLSRWKKTVVASSCLLGLEDSAPVIKTLLCVVIKTLEQHRHCESLIPIISECKMCFCDCAVSWELITWSHIWRKFHYYTWVRFRFI